MPSPRKNLIFGAGRGPRLAVLELIKRSGTGMSVSDLATKLGMSYMGVKAHCIALTSTGHLATSREPSSKGRPRLLYKLAESGESLFVDEGTCLILSLLKEAGNLFGVAAPQKLLLMVFRSQAVAYREKLTGKGIAEKAKMLVRLRDQEGRLSVLEGSDTWKIIECHNPLAAVMKEYPEASQFEAHMISEVLGVRVMRQEVGGKVIFQS